MGAPRYAPDVKHNTEHVFGFRVDSPTVATLDPAEHIAQLWLPWQEAMATVFFAHKSRRDPAIAATGSRAYWPGMTAPHQESVEAGPVQLGPVRLGQPAFLHRRPPPSSFAPYFANVMVGNAVEGQAAWAFTQSTSGILIALMSPFLGAMGRRRRPPQNPTSSPSSSCLGLGLRRRFGGAYPGRPDLIGPDQRRCRESPPSARRCRSCSTTPSFPTSCAPKRMGWLSGFRLGAWAIAAALIALFMVLGRERPAAVRPGSQDLHARAACRAGIGLVARRVS